MYHIKVNMTSVCHVYYNSQSFFRKSKKKLIIPMMLVIVLVTAIISCMVSLNDYYRADTKAMDAFMPANSVSKQVLTDNTIVYVPENIRAGFIFYPGGKVEYTSYEPLMESLASEGIFCVLVEMPFHLAVFDMDAAEGIQEKFLDIYLNMTVLQITNKKKDMNQQKILKKI